MSKIVISGEKLYNKAKLEVKLDSGKTTKLTIFPYFVLYSSKFFRSKYANDYIGTSMNLDFPVKKDVITNLMKIIHEQNIAVEREDFRSLCQLAVKLKVENMYPLLRETIKNYKMNDLEIEFEKLILQSSSDLDSDETESEIPNDSYDFTLFIIDLYRKNKKKAIHIIINHEINEITNDDLEKINNAFNLPILDSFIQYNNLFEQQGDEIDRIKKENNELNEQIQILQSKTTNKIERIEKISEEDEDSEDITNSKSKSIISDDDDDITSKNNKFIINNEITEDSQDKTFDKNNGTEDSQYETLDKNNQGKILKIVDDFIQSEKDLNNIDTDQAIDNFIKFIVAKIMINRGKIKGNQNTSSKPNLNDDTNPQYSSIENSIDSSDDEIENNQSDIDNQNNFQNSTQREIMRDNSIDSSDDEAEIYSYPGNQNSNQTSQYISRNNSIDNYDNENENNIEDETNPQIPHENAVDESEFSSTINEELDFDLLKNYNKPTFERLFNRYLQIRSFQEFSQWHNNNHNNVLHEIAMNVQNGDILGILYDNENTSEIDNLLKENNNEDNTPLEIAILHKNSKFTEIALRNCENLEALNKHDNDLRSPYENAFKTLDINLFRPFLERSEFNPCLLEKISGENMLPIYYIIKNDNSRFETDTSFQFFKAIYAKMKSTLNGAINIPLYDDQTITLFAQRLHKWAILNYLIDDNSLKDDVNADPSKMLDLNQQSGKDKYSMLHYACLQGDFKTAKLLLQSRRVQLDLESRDKKTPLLCSVFGPDNTQCLEILLDAEEDLIIAKNEYAKNALHFACHHGNLNCVKYLMKITKNGKPTFDVNLGDKRGYTPLHFAAQNNRAPVCQYLIEELHCEVNPTCQDGKTPFFWAVEQGSTEAYEYMKDIPSVDQNKPDKNGFYPIHMGIKNGFIQIFMDLIHRGFDPNIVSNDGITPCMLAAQMDRDISITQLINLHDFKINLKSNCGMTALHYAAKQGKSKAAKALLSSPEIDPNIIDDKGFTPLHYACKENQITIIKILAEDYRVDLVISSKIGEPLSNCGNNEEAIKTLDDYISKRKDDSRIRGYKRARQMEQSIFAEPNTPSPQLPKPIGRIPEQQPRQHLSQINQQVSNQKRYSACNPQNSQDSSDNSDDDMDISSMNLGPEGKVDTTLTFLAQKGKTDDFKNEYRRGHSLNDFDSERRTPLHIAVINNRTDIVDFILQQPNFNPNATDRLGKWPLYCAIESVKFNVAMKLVKCPKIRLDMKLDNGQTILHLCAIKNAASFATDLFQYLQQNRQTSKSRRIDINAKDRDGKTAIHLAAQKGTEAILKKLLEFNPSFEINSQDNDMRTPLHWAAATNREGIVSYLIKNASIDFNIKDKNGRTPAFLAAENSYKNILKAIISCPSYNPNSTDKDGSTLLITCAQRGNKEIAEYLAQIPNIDLNCRDKLGRTPLHITAENGKVDFFKWLLEQDKVDVNKQDNTGRTPLHVAAMSNEECVRALLYCGKLKKLNTHIQDTNGKYASSYCKSFKLSQEIDAFSQ